MKVCGLTRVEDARHAAESGADYLGAILTEGFGRSIAPERARAFADLGLPVVGVLVDPTTADATTRARAAAASVLQLHGDEPPALLDALRTEGDWQIWKAVRPRTVDDLRRAIAGYAEHADALLVDGWHAELKGGSGTRFDWELVARVRGEIPHGLALVAAGGLTAANVADAMAALAPDVVDVSSGVESSPGHKDPAQVEAFIRAARGRAALEEAR